MGSKYVAVSLRQRERASFFSLFFLRLLHCFPGQIFFRRILHSANTQADDAQTEQKENAATVQTVTAADNLGDHRLSVQTNKNSNLHIQQLESRLQASFRYEAIRRLIVPAGSRSRGEEVTVQV